MEPAAASAAALPHARPARAARHEPYAQVGDGRSRARLRDCREAQHQGVRARARARARGTWQLHARRRAGCSQVLMFVKARRPPPRPAHPAQRIRARASVCGLLRDHRSAPRPWAVPHPRPACGSIGSVRQGGGGAGPRYGRARTEARARAAAAAPSRPRRLVPRGLPEREGTALRQRRRRRPPLPPPPLPAAWVAMRASACAALLGGALHSGARSSSHSAAASCSAWSRPTRWSSVAKSSL